MSILLYKDQDDKSKYAERDSSVEGWKLPGKLRITSEGRNLVESEPNVNQSTTRMLLQSEAAYLKESELNLTSGFISDEDIVRDVFESHDGIGYAHLTQCILEKKTQCFAELAATYAMERKLPFIVSVIYLKSLENLHGYFYFAGNPGNYKKVPWSPATAYIAPATISPPYKKQQRTRRVPLEHPVKEVTRKILNCPYCGNPGKLIRCGKEGLMWQVCCTDPDRKCRNFVGAESVPHAKTQKTATTLWNQYVVQEREKLKKN